MTLALRTPATPAAQHVSPIATALATFEDKLASLLPKDVPVARVFAELDVMAGKNPGLVDAIKHGPERAVAAVIECLQTNLIIGKTIFPVPFKNSKTGNYDWTVIAGYQGLIELMAASGMPVQASAVWDCDHFKHGLGSNPFVDHHEGPAAKRTQIIAAYAVGFRRHGLPPLVMVLDRTEIEKRRAKSKSWSPTSKPPYATLEQVAWYAPKSAVRAIANYAPKNPQLASLLANEAHDEDDPPVVITATAVIAEEPAATGPALVVDAEGAVAAADDGLTLAEAEAMTFGKKKTPLAKLPSVGPESLSTVRAYAMKKGLELEEAKQPTAEMERLAAACKMILDARDKGETEEDDGMPF